MSIFSKSLTRMRWRSVRIWSTAWRSWSCTPWWRRRIAVVWRGWRNPAARGVPSVWVRRIRVRVPWILWARRWSRRRLGHRCCLRLLFRGWLHLFEDWARIQATPVELAFVCQEVLSVMLFQRVSSTGRGSDAELCCNVLPSFVLRGLEGNKEELKANSTYNCT